jgi:hypothetical protein
LLGAPVSSIRDRRLPASTLPGLDAEALTRAVEAGGEREQAVAAMEAALEPLLPAEPGPEIEAVVGDPALPAARGRRAGD